MAAATSPCLALLVRSGPYQGRSARDQVDIALAAASLEYSLELFFLGQGALQLLIGADAHAADLPRGARAWRSLHGLTPVRAWVEPGMRARLAASGQQPLLEVGELQVADMAARVAACDLVWVV